MERGAVAIDAAVHHGEDAGGLRARRGFLVHHAVLEPERRELQPDAGIDDRRHVLGTTEDVHDVHPLAGGQHLGQVIEVGDRPLAERRVDGRIDRNHAVAEALQAARHAMARARGVGRQPDDSYGARRAQQPLDFLRLGIAKHLRAIVPTVVGASDKQEHTVEIRPHGRRIRVGRDVPVLEAALAEGLNLPHSCKSGHCASCRARLVQGEIEYPNGVLPIGLTEAEAREGYVLLCQARARSDLVVEARVVERLANVEIRTLPCRIERLVPLAPDVLQVFLRLPAVERLGSQPGQYLDVLIEGGRRRSFSIASPPHDSELLELHVRRVAGGGFTEKLFGAGGAGTALGPGALLRIEGPMGQFVYRESARPALFVAGGTGFAPLKSMLRHVLEHAADAGSRTRTLHLFWGARTAADVYEEALVQEWVRAHPRLKFTAVLSEATAVVAAHHRLGLVHEAALAEYPRLEDHDVYAAGPPAMIEAMRASFPAHGLPPERLFFDSFDYAPDARAPRPAAGT